jgi:hypothetical protein
LGDRIRRHLPAAHGASCAVDQKMGWCRIVRACGSRCPGSIVRWSPRRSVLGFFAREVCRKMRISCDFGEPSPVGRDGAREA